jgi:cell division protease FtsH
VSIVARSRSLGLTFTLPEDRFNHSRSQLRDTMAMCLGGRTAEEIVFAEPTTGAENDIEKVTRIARAMVTEYGMSEALGPQQLGQREGEVFLGRELNHQANYSEEVAGVVDREIRTMIDEAHQRARSVLVHHRATLDHMARELVEKETLDPMDLEAILGPLASWGPKGPVRAPATQTRSSSNGRRSGRGDATPVGTAVPVPPPARPARRRPAVAPAPTPARVSRAAKANPVPAPAPTPAKGRRKVTPAEEVPVTPRRGRSRPKANES